MFWLHHTTKTSLKPLVVRPETMRERRLLSNPSLTFDCLTSLGLLTIGVQLRRHLLCYGIGGSTTGRAATLLLVDDPIKAREEADIAKQRNKTWSYYFSALTTRKQHETDGTSPLEIMILTRWHVDDVAGRLMETDDWKEGAWHHINFPAVKLVSGGVKQSVASLPPDDPRYIPSGKLSTVSTAKIFFVEDKEE